MSHYRPIMLRSPEWPKEGLSCRSYFQSSAYIAKMLKLIVWCACKFHFEVDFIGMFEYFTSNKSLYWENCQRKMVLQSNHIQSCLSTEKGWKTLACVQHNVSSLVETARRLGKRRNRKMRLLIFNNKNPNQAANSSLTSH